jgi:hypothetical protein
VSVATAAPTLSVLTALLDSDPLVDETAASLAGQLSARTEWVIKNSANVASAELRRVGELPHVRLVLEKDASVYQGMNQALSAATGRYFVVVGAGDTLKPAAVGRMLDAIDRFPQVSALFFAIDLARRPGASLVPAPQELPVRMATPHPGTLLKRHEALDLGGFCLDYKIAADYDLISRYLQKHQTYAVSTESVVDYRDGGLSAKRNIEGYLEEELIRTRLWHAPTEQVAERMGRIAALLQRPSPRPSE